MKYDSQLTEVKKLLPASQSILIALPSNPTIDNLAAALGLFLMLEAAGKLVSVACETDIIVGQSHLFGVDHIQKNIPVSAGGNLTLTLEGVAASDNTVPALEKLDWFAQDNNLNLVFHVLPGQNFQPAKIIPKYQGSSFGLIFVIGAVNLNALGNIYTSNQQIFSGSHLVNVDLQSGNTSFGQTNILDPQSASLSEMMVNLIADLGFNLDADCASNLLIGIFDATANLSGSKVTADTFMAVANCLRAGGKKPGVATVAEATGVSAQNTPSAQPAYDWNAVSAALGQNIAPATNTAEFTVPAVAAPMTDAGDHETVVNQQAGQPSAEERPSQEGVISETVEPEWLTPKIFKGSSLG